MQVNAIYEDGAIKFSQTLRFKHRKFEVIVNIPESEIDLQIPPSPPPGSGATNDSGHDPAGLFLTKIQQILGPYYHQRPAASVEQDKASYIDALTEKQSK